MEPTPPPTSARDALLRAASEELAEKGHASVSLRAVARRANVSHAAPAHFFGDRAGMLTAVATAGFDQLDAALAAAAIREGDADESPLAALGRAYVDFGLEHPALVDLMFRRSELNADDDALIEAQRGALGRLRTAVGDVADAHADEWSLLSWAVVHGLVSLVREGVLARIVEQDPDAAPALARRLVEVYAAGVAPASRS
ncbi:TetR/AcrR family transcriptional regulator [Microbacterium sp. SSM24]|uniref:TetR/AcrR family transcriptional regulator n=1 Tax=Microbacterium sp. SSM24 TaxID=2991714 RepID=UPI002226966A|nr:TetR/AcrR family transcriptional regulator [Microbacterium sp. SSM24]MCW3492516.1 TetR/AcrR family transcriptional regulator [Microbacterium sp. SSM24]